MKHALEDRGYNTWMDIEKMAGSTLGAMADAVEGSDAIVIVMTKCVDNPFCPFDDGFD